MRGMKHFVVLVFTGFLLNVATAGAVVQKGDAPPAPSRVPGRLIVKLKAPEAAGFSAAAAQAGAAQLQSVPQSLAALHRSFRMTRMARLYGARGAAAASSGPAESMDRTFVVHLDPSGDLDAALAAYRADANVEWAEPDQFVYPLFVPNDPLFSQQWALNKVQAPWAWDIHRGAPSVRVAVLDTGIMGPGATGTDGLPGHPELRQKVVLAADFTGSPYGAEDRHGHGTHVAGIVAAEANNGLGVAGLAHGVSLMNGKVLGDSGAGSFETVAAGIRWAADNGARVISMSLGAGVACSSVVQDPINYAWSKGVLVVAAAGNSNYPASHAPANCANAVSVAATNAADARASFSNYGADVDIAAPGDDILSTVTDASGYGPMSGTSMATPLVSALAGLILSQKPDWTPAQVQSLIESTADDLGAPGKDFEFANGRINAGRALRGLLAPTVIVSAPSQGQILSGVVNISGTAADPGFLTYRVDIGVGHNTTPVQWFTGPASSTPVVNGLLRTIDTRGFSDGAYTIRLYVTDRQVFSHEVRVLVYFVNSAQPATLAIASPATGAVVSGTVPVTGSVTGGGLISYRLDVAAGSNPGASDWRLGATRLGQVTSGPLGEVFTGGLPAGPASIRLWATDAQSRTFEQRATVHIAPWTSRAIVPGTPATNSRNSLAVDAGGAAHVAFHLGNALTYARWTGAAWSIETVDAASAGDSVELALDAAGSPMIVYVGNGATRLARKSGASWTSEVVAPAGFGRPFLAADPDGRPVIFYRSADIFSGLQIVRWSGAAWSTQTVAGGLSDTPHALALDTEGRPAILTGLNGLTLTRWTGAAWSTTAVPLDPQVISVFYASLAIDRQNQAAVSYVAMSNAGGLNMVGLAREDGGAWTSRFVDWADRGSLPDGRIQAVSQTSLAIGPSREPIVAYKAFDGLTAQNQMKAAQWTDMGFAVEIIDGAAGGNSSLAVGRDGKARISYFDYIGGAYKLADRSAPFPPLPDATPPTATVTVPAADAIVSGTTTVKAAAADNRELAGVRFQAGPLASPLDATPPYAWNFDTTALPDGPYFFTAVAQDNAGLVSTSPAVRAYVDNSAPAITLTAHATHISSSVLTWTTNEDAFVRGDYGTSPSFGFSTTETTAPAKSHVTLLTGLSPNTFYWLQLRARDRAGRVSLQAASVMTRTAPDTTPATPLGWSIVHLASGAADLTLRWDEPVMMDFRYHRLDAPQFATATTVSVFAATQTVRLSNLLPGATYAFSASHIDQAGNIGGPWQNMFVAPPAPDRTPAVPSFWFVNHFAADAADILLAWNEPVTIEFRHHRVDAPLFATSTAIGMFSATHTVRLSSLTPGATYAFNVLYADQARNLGGPWTQTFVIPWTADRVPPNLGAATVRAGRFRAEISWTTDEPAIGRLFHGPSPDVSLETLSSTQPALAHRVVLAGLSPGATCYFRVAARDAAGNETLGDARSFRPRPLPALLTRHFTPGQEVLQGTPVLVEAMDMPFAEPGVLPLPEPNLRLTLRVHADAGERTLPLSPAPGQSFLYRAVLDPAAMELGAGAVRLALEAQDAGPAMALGEADFAYRRRLPLRRGDEKLFHLPDPNPDDGELRVELPAGYDPGGIDVESAPEVAPPDGAPAPLAVYAFTAAREAPLPKPATLTLLYRGMAGGGSAAPGTAESDLKVFRKDGDQWTLIGGVVDPAQDTITVRTQRLSVFAVGLAAPAGAKAPQKFLSPLPADGINDAASFGLEAVEVVIVDITGRKVFEARQENGTAIAWTCRDDGGRWVPSGAYIAKVKKADGSVVYQSLAVVK